VRDRKNRTEKVDISDDGAVTMTQESSTIDMVAASSGNKQKLNEYEAIAMPTTKTVG